MEDAEKRKIRKSVLRERDRLDDEERRVRSRAVEEHLFRVPGWPSHGAVLFFHTMRSEVLTPPMIRRALALGTRVALPRMAPGGNLQLHAVQDLDADLEENDYGIPEPLPALPPVSREELGIIIVPGVAFDPEGFRVGYGGGFYDRLLAGAPRAHRIAIGFDLQRIERAPRGPFDLPVDLLVTESGPKPSPARPGRPDFS